MEHTKLDNLCKHVIHIRISKYKLLRTKEKERDDFLRKKEKLEAEKEAQAACPYELKWPSLTRNLIFEVEHFFSWSKMCVVNAEL